MSPTDKFPDEIQFCLARDGVCLGEFLPRDLDSCGLKTLDLGLCPGEGDDGIHCAMSNEESLLPGNGRKFCQSFFGFKNVAADANDPREFVRITQRDIK